MKLVLPLLCLASTLAPPAPAADGPRSPAVECNARAGIPNALRKLRAGGEGTIRVAYLGGSITAAPGWRVKSLAWLQQRFPTAKLAEINAAIGGTGSDLGVFRLAQDVLQARPDLLFSNSAAPSIPAASTPPRSPSIPPPPTRRTSSSSTTAPTSKMTPRNTPPTTGPPARSC